MNDMKYTPEELVPIVAELAAKYTGYEHSSISYEKAQMLMSAVLYCIHELDAADGNTLQTSSLSAKEAYLSGREIVMAKVRKLQNLYDDLISDFQDFGSICLKATVKGIPLFLLHYDAVYAPQETLLALDYPVLKDPGNASGVDAVLEYVNCLCLEQRFLNTFDTAFVIDTLCRYHEDYGHLVENLCPILLQSMIVHMILHKPFNVSSYTEEDLAHMNHFLEGKSPAEVNAAIAEMIAELIARYFDGDTLLQEYLSLAIPDIAARLPFLLPPHAPI